MRTLAYRRDIDALRGVAVALVVLFHAFPTVIAGGFIGVDVFFVISGYLITRIIIKEQRASTFSIRTFYMRRIRRLFPALATVLLFCLAAGWLVLFTDEFRQLGIHTVAAVAYVLNFTLLGEVGYFDVDAKYKPLLHLWSLSVEEQFYLVWPILLAVSAQFQRVRVAAIAAITFFSFAYWIIIAENAPSTAFYNTLARAWQLGAGALVAVLGLTIPPRFRFSAFCLGAVGIALGATMLNENNYPGFGAAAPTIGAALIIAAGRSDGHFLGLDRLGLISYPLYLWHWPLMAFSAIYLGFTPPPGTMLGLVALSVALATITFFTVEQLRHEMRATIWLVAALAGIGVLGAVVWRADGAPKRAHLDYLQGLELQFERTPSTNDLCLSTAREILGEDPLFEYCRASGLDHSRLIAVFGDSHAHALYDGVAAVAAKQGVGVVLFANSNCPPLLGAPWGRNDKEREKCIKKTRQILAMISAIPRIDTTVFVTRGPSYVYGDIDFTITRETVERSMLERDIESFSFTEFQTGFAATVEHLEAVPHVGRIIYFLENPELDFLPRERSGRPFRLFGGLRETDVSRALYDLRMGPYRDIIRGTTGEKLTVLDLGDALCRGDFCFAFHNGFLYADDDHLSVRGAQYVVRHFEDEIFDPIPSRVTGE